MAFHQNFILTLKRIKKMKRNKIVLASLCFYLFQISQVISQNTVIEYNSFVENVIKNNPIAKRAANLKTYGELNYKSARGNYDPKINGSYTNKFFNGSNYNSSLNSDMSYVEHTNNILTFDNSFNYSSLSLNYIGPLFSNSDGFIFLISSAKDINYLVIDRFSGSIKLLNY